MEKERVISPLEAAWEIHQFFIKHKIPYVIIGGLAVQHWGEPRFTRNVDITTMAPTEKTEEFVSLIVENFASRVENPLQFAKETRMILINASNGCEIDIALGLPGYEEEVMRRAVIEEFEPGKQARLCSAEDLIIHKAVAGRPRDWDDVKSVIYRQGHSLDVAYIRYWLKEFAAALENQLLVEEFEKYWRLHK